MLHHGSGRLPGGGASAQRQWVPHLDFGQSHLVLTVSRLLPLQDACVSVSPDMSSTVTTERSSTEAAQPKGMPLLAQRTSSLAEHEANQKLEWFSLCTSSKLCLPWALPSYFGSHFLSPSFPFFQNLPHRLWGKQSPSITASPTDTIPLLLPLSLDMSNGDTCFSVLPSHRGQIVTHRTAL